MRKSPSGSQPVVGQYHVETRTRADGIVISTMVGLANGELAKEVEKQLKDHLRPGTPVDWIPDASGITKVDLVSLMGPAKSVLTTFKRGGGRFVVVITASDMVKMAARTISAGAHFMGGASINDIVMSLSEALTKIEDLRNHKESA